MKINKDCTSLNKGIEGKLTQDTYRAVQDKETGSITFNKVKMINVVFVKHEGLDKIYAFENKSDERLKEGTKVLVETKNGNEDAIVVSSIKIQKKYLSGLTKAICGEYRSKLKPVVGVYKEVKVENLVVIGGDK